MLSHNTSGSATGIDSCLPLGRVVEQQPRGGATVTVGTSVELVVSVGPDDTHGGCNGKSTKIITNLKNFFGDLFLLGLLTITLLSWRALQLRP